MIRKALVLALVLVSVSAYAQNRGHATPPPFPISGATVTGFVTAVNGSQVSLANGLVVIDVSQATVTDDRGKAATISAGSMIFAVMKSTTSLQAATVVVASNPQVTLTGPVQSVNASAGTFQLLGLTIHTDANTSFGGSHSIRRLSDIVAGDIAAVQANATGGNLVAASILVFAPVPQPAPILLHGTVKSIGTDSWVITDARRGDITVAINGQTKILGSPKVGDGVDVLANVDSANNYVAIAISVSPVSTNVHFTGKVKQINATNWVIGPSVGLGPDRIVQVNANTKIVGNPKVGDMVDVVLDPSTALNVALSITLISPTPTQHITGVIRSMAIASGPMGPAQIWTISPDGGGSDVGIEITPSTTFPNSRPSVGDRVDAVVQKNGEAYIAISITKL